MRTFGSDPSLDVRGRVRGAGMIGLLVVVVIIMIIMVFFSPLAPNGPKPSDAITYQERAKDSVCRIQMDNVRTAITQLQLANPGALISPKILEKQGKLPPCPEGGEYVIKNGVLYCTKHFPPPPDPTPAGAPAPVAAATAPAPTATPQ